MQKEAFFSKFEVL